MNLAQRFDLNPEPIAKRDILDRINVDIVSHADFVDKYERLLKPVILTNVTKSWPAKDKWTIAHFLKQYRNERFKCGEDDFGYNVKMKMKYFVYYMNTNCDDSPLYIFDGNFGEVNRLEDLLVPFYFLVVLFAPLITTNLACSTFYLSNIQYYINNKK